MLAPSICNGPPCRCSTTCSISLEFSGLRLVIEAETFRRLTHAFPNGEVGRSHLSKMVG